MHSSPRFQAVTTRFSPSNLRSSFRARRRDSSGSESSSVAGHCASASPSHSRASSTDRRSYGSNDSSTAAETINSIIVRQPSYVSLQEERRCHATELGILEPRPMVYWGSVEERMGSLNAALR